MALRNKAPAHLIDNILLKTLRPMRPSASQNAELVLGWAHSGHVKPASYNIDRVVIPYIFGIVVTSSLIIILLIMARSLSQNLKTFVRPLPLSLSSRDSSSSFKCQRVVPASSGIRLSASQGREGLRIHSKATDIHALRCSVA